MSSNKIAVKSYLDQDEYETLINQAGRAGLSLSTFIKRVCLAQEVRSTVDQEAVLALLKSKADLGRLGGLLKHHLSESSQNAAPREELRGLLKTIETSQRELAGDFKRVSQGLLNKGENV